MLKILRAGLLLTLLMPAGSGQAQSSQRSSASRTVWDGVFFHAQADRGEVDFSKHCSRCHDGSGDGLILSSEEFFNSWREERLSALFNYLKITMPADNPGSLSEREYLDTLTYILQINFTRLEIQTSCHRNWTEFYSLARKGPSRYRPERPCIPSAA